MTNPDLINVLIAGSEAMDYALKHCADELESAQAVRNTRTALTATHSVPRHDSLPSGK